MDRNKKKTIRRGRRKTGIRKRILGMPERPRLSVFRSAKHIYGQVIDDSKDAVLATASTMEPDLRESLKWGGNCEAAAVVGKRLGERSLEKGIKAVFFDRNGLKYHGRVKALGDAAREAGLSF